MNTDEIKAKVRQSIAENKSLKLIGYHSGSTGTISDMTVNIGGGEAYAKLLRESVVFVGDLPEQCADGLGCTAAEWQQAKAEQQKSWITSLQKISEPIKDLKYKPEPEGWWSDPCDQNVVVIKNLIAESAPVEKTASAHRNAVTAAKAWLRANSPMRQYVGMVVLSPAKVQDIEVL